MSDVLASCTVNAPKKAFPAPVGSTTFWWNLLGPPSPMTGLKTGGSHRNPRRGWAMRQPCSAGLSRHLRHWVQCQFGEISLLGVRLALESYRAPQALRRRRSSWWLGETTSKRRMISRIDGSVAGEHSRGSGSQTSKGRSRMLAA